jgi:hypothetical protein
MDERTESGRSKAQFVADVLNKTLYTLVTNCSKADGVRNYFDVGVIAYGGTEVGSGFGGALYRSNFSMEASNRVLLAWGTDCICEGEPTREHKRQPQICFFDRTSLQFRINEMPVRDAAQPLDIRSFEDTAYGLPDCHGYFVDFDFQKAGIKVRQGTFPIVKMDWVEGDPLGVWLEPISKLLGGVDRL